LIGLEVLSQIAAGPAAFHHFEQHGQILILDMDVHVFSLSATKSDTAPE
jgi:DNA-binding transcriptional regulator LsrR (DeoR family)